MSISEADGIYSVRSVTQSIISLPALKSAVSLAILAAGDSKSRPTYQDVRIESGTDRLTVSCCDGELSITVCVRDVEGTPGSAQVPAALIEKTLGTMSGKTVSLNLAGETLKVDGGGIMDIRTSPALQVKWPDLKDPTTITVDSDTLSKGLEYVRVCVLEGETVEAFPHLAGVELSAHSEIYLTATDRNHMARYSIGPASLPTRSSVSIPERAVVALAKLTKMKDDPIEISYGPKGLVAKGPNFELKTKVLTGNFPNCQAVIDSVKPTTEIQVMQPDLKNALAGVLIAANPESFPRVRMVYDTGKFTVCASTVVASFSQDIPLIEVMGPEFKVMNGAVAMKKIVDKLRPIRVVLGVCRINGNDFKTLRNPAIPELIYLMGPVNWSED